MTLLPRELRLLVPTVIRTVLCLRFPVGSRRQLYMILLSGKGMRRRVLKWTSRLILALLRVGSPMKWTKMDRLEMEQPMMSFPMPSLRMRLVTVLFTPARCKFLVDGLSIMRCAVQWLRTRVLPEAPEKMFTEISREFMPNVMTGCEPVTGDPRQTRRNDSTNGMPPVACWGDYRSIEWGGDGIGSCSSVAGFYNPWTMAALEYGERCPTSA